MENSIIYYSIITFRYNKYIPTNDNKVATAQSKRFALSSSNTFAFCRISSNEF